ncbi:UNVERIFIED_ORG: hypothetical protein DFO82_2666 [Idiomarina abyssalis]|uniref:hypothetical protein n=1 Tax=unclassified Idiomarina TaxID=2614829 RepID=UPI000E0F257F|nr:hypothetical protein [Idiomarina sp. 017G]TDO45138.1 hypothetical protein DEU30_11424 [Idiomarina sp. 017G]
MKKTAKMSVEVVTDIVCDKCGESLVPEIQKDYQENLNDFADFGVLKASFGYGSGRDGESFHFDLCEICFMELVNKVMNRS